MGVMSEFNGCVMGNSLFEMVREGVWGKVGEEGNWVSI